MRHDDWGVRSSRWAGIRSETVTVSGARVHVLRADAAADAPAGAPTQMLLHGLGGGGAFLLDLMVPLIAYGPVVAPDLPGSIFGETETPRPNAARVDSNARFLRRSSRRWTSTPPSCTAGRWGRPSPSGSLPAVRSGLSGWSWPPRRCLRR